KFFQQLKSDPTAETPLRWQAQAGEAGVRDAMGKTAEAERLYRAAIATIEKARGSIHHDELRLSFLSSGIGVYGDYIDFLVRHGRAKDALHQAELSRSRTLAEGLASDEPVREDAAKHPEELARRLHATLLTYWLGEKHSYLWVITPGETSPGETSPGETTTGKTSPGKRNPGKAAPAKTTLFSLPPQSEIEPLVKSYRQAQAQGADVLHASTADGEKLYELLVAPAKKLIPANSRVIVLPDGALYTLNFETLIVPEPQPHFWIEDATLTTANSLTLLEPGLSSASHSATDSSAAACKPGSGFSGTGKGACAEKLLLVGDALQANADFPPLPQAPKEMALIEKYFPPEERAVLSRDKATASAYLASHPERYAYLHFVTHGTASRARPLESAVILSPESSEGDTYKLYAREIVKHRLTAQLVTISACNGSGTRAYSGEGLVGLSWAFLRAGAHNVIGALWEVSDTATPQLMDEMYSELAAGKDPATALRDAKLKFLHSTNVFAKPFYWAPFELYSAS
ncbi:MAG TPA: CHAT domain-containing protein, partial [Candidatus Acidoferrales bacterium]|nr:CHAT domain-containing protein [Candidatus Acidoferrales bacterium]